MASSTIFSMLQSKIAEKSTHEGHHDIMVLSTMANDISPTACIKAMQWLKCEMEMEGKKAPKISQNWHRPVSGGRLLGCCRYVGQ